MEMEHINENTIRVLIKSEDLELSFQDDMRTMKVFYGYGNNI